MRVKGSVACLLAALILITNLATATASIAKSVYDPSVLESVTKEESIHRNLIEEKASNPFSPFGNLTTDTDSPLTPTPNKKIQERCPKMKPSYSRGTNKCSTSLRWKCYYGAKCQNAKDKCNRTIKCACEDGIFKCTKTTSCSSKCTKRWLECPTFRPSKRDKCFSRKKTETCYYGERCENAKGQCKETRTSCSCIAGHFKCTNKEECKKCLARSPPAPTLAPTDGPTNGPTDSPTTSPTSEPMSHPTFGPTAIPTLAPTDGPTDNPTNLPTNSPTSLPTSEPTSYPTFGPTPTRDLYELVGSDKKCPTNNRLFRTTDYNPLGRNECYEKCNNNPHCEYFSFGESDNLTVAWKGLCIGCSGGATLQDHTGFNSYEIFP